MDLCVVPALNKKEKKLQAEVSNELETERGKKKKKGKEGQHDLQIVRGGRGKSACRIQKEKERERLLKFQTMREKRGSSTNHHRREKKGLFLTRRDPKKERGD